MIAEQGAGIVGAFDHLELQGAERDSAIREIESCVRDWGLEMPKAEPIPLHFGLNDFRDIGETEFWIANESEFGYCGKFLFVFDGQTCPHHYHKVKHETFFVLKGAVLMRTGDDERTMRQGDVLTMPAGVAHSFTGIGAALILEVSMPSSLHDNFFVDKGIGEDGVI